MEKFTKFARIAEIEFSNIVLSTQDLGTKLRIYIKDKSFIDFSYTTILKSRRFSIHWERAHLDKTFYRLDNTPDKKWMKINTYPIHFHNSEYSKVRESPFAIKENLSLEVIFRMFLNFSKSKLEDNK